MVATAEPAAAAARLEVEAGWAGGHYVPGRPVPVRVDVTADQLTTRPPCTRAATVSANDPTNVASPR
jgi:hypothetical protein